MKERKFRTKFSVASVNEYLTKHPSSYGDKNKQISGYGTSTPSQLSTQKHSNHATFYNPNFGYSYYQKDPNRTQQHPIRKSLINENGKYIDYFEY